MASFTQAQPPSLYKRIRRKIRRIARLTVGYIKHTRAYISYRQYRHTITGPLRMARADLKREEHRRQKAQQQQEQEQIAAQFLPLYLTQEPTPEHPLVQVQSIPLPLCGGAPVQVRYDGEFAQRYHQEVARQDITQIDTHRKGARPVRRLHPMPTIKLTPPERVPEHLGTTTTDDLFLLDQPVQPQMDTDATLPRIQKVRLS